MCELSGKGPHYLSSLDSWSPEGLLALRRSSIDDRSLTMNTKAVLIPAMLVIIFAKSQYEILKSKLRKVRDVTPVYRLPLIQF